MQIDGTGTNSRPPALVSSHILTGPRTQKFPPRRLFSCTASFLAALLISGVALAQRPRQIGRAAQQAQQAQRAGPLGMQPSRDQHAHPPGFFKRLRELPPSEQEGVMANDQRFRQLPLERQAQIRKNLEHWNSLTPQQKEQTRVRQEILESLSPAQREEARAIFPQYNRLPPDRKNAVMAAFRRVRDFPPARRERFLSSPQAAQRFSPQELNVLRRLTGLLPGERGSSAGGRDPEN